MSVLKGILERRAQLAEISAHKVDKYFSAAAKSKEQADHDVKHNNPNAKEAKKTSEKRMKGATLASHPRYNHVREDAEQSEELAEGPELVKKLGIKGAKSVSAPGDSLFKDKGAQHQELQTKLGEKQYRKAKPVKEETEELAEGKLRLVGTHKSDNGKHEAKVYHDSEWGEHRVKYFINGKHHEPADYHTDDKQDAHATAQHELKRLDKLHGALKEDVDPEYIEELSKATLNNYVHGASHDIMKRSAGVKNTKRAAGMEKAVAKLAKEDAKPLGAILDEAFDKGGRPKKKRDLNGEIAKNA